MAKANSSKTTRTQKTPDAPINTLIDPTDGDNTLYRAKCVARYLAFTVAQYVADGESKDASAGVAIMLESIADAVEYGRAQANADAAAVHHG